MKQLGLNDIREKFINFFEERNHLRLKSAPLIPQNDKSLLLISAGMAPFKPFFTGQETPPAKKVVTCQKCVRTNDIENVGVTSRHCTFFEMLGSFSFGDYFKETIIPLAWQFLTAEMEIPAEKLFPSVYLEDEEAFDIWVNKVGLSPERITKLGKEDNFWEIGAGPCGPCSEIYFDRGAENGCGKADCKPGCDCDRFVEIWNLVFIQFNKDEAGNYTNLENTGIDTGMGLERISMVMQNVSNIFDVDTFKAVRDTVCAIAGVNYGKSEKGDKSIRIVTEHMRAVVFMLSDGILPSNEGRGYVLRRLLRRASRHGRLLGINDLFLERVAESVISVSGEAYPELKEKADYIFKLLNLEEKRFSDTLGQGMEILKKLIGTLKENLTPAFLGSQAFLLYDTYGFPLELTMEILKDEGLDMEIEMKAFNSEMEKQRSRARFAREETNYMGSDMAHTAFDELSSDITTEFFGYSKSSINGKVCALISENQLIKEAAEGTEVIIIPDKTVFYAESGGQKGDSGTIKTETGTVQVFDCQKISGNRFIHSGKVIHGSVAAGQEALISYDIEARNSAARNHTATHLLHKALKEVLGNHVEQAGSLVSKDRLRFDFTHFSPVTPAELTRIERIVNEKSLEGMAVETFEASIDDARKMGAVALFGEKYGDTVRVVKMGDYSMELCGGTHLDNTAKTGMFKILAESGIAAGVRRIEAVTGMNTIAFYQKIEENLKEAANIIKASPDNFLTKIRTFMDDWNGLVKEVGRLKDASAGGVVDAIFSAAEDVGGIKVAAAFVDNISINDQRALSDKIKDRLKMGIVILLASYDGKNTLLVSATEDAVKAGVHCGNIVKETAKAFLGNGGGRPNMAQAGIPAGVSSDDVLAKAKSFVRQLI